MHCCKINHAFWSDSHRAVELKYKNEIKRDHETICFQKKEKKKWSQCTYYCTLNTSEPDFVATPELENISGEENILIYNTCITSLTGLLSLNGMLLFYIQSYGTNTLFNISGAKHIYTKQIWQYSFMLYPNFVWQNKLFLLLRMFFFFIRIFQCGSKIHMKGELITSVVKWINK